MKIVDVVCEPVRGQLLVVDGARSLAGLDYNDSQEIR
jgi:hypothetical protein